jgi:TRAP-type uncharacterized transport system substrate-binding protein
MPAQKMSGFRKRDRLLSALGLFALLVAAVMTFRFFVSRAGSIATISAGNAAGIRHRLLLVLGRQTQWSDLRIVPIPTTGTLEILERLEAGTLDFGLIEGGFDMSRFSDIRQVAALGVEPVQLLVKPEIHAEVSQDLRKLRGRTIDLGGGVKSAAFWLSRAILRFVGLPPESYQIAQERVGEGRPEMGRERLPDAFFIASPLPSDLAERLVNSWGYLPVPLPFGEAFRLRAFDAPIPQPENAILVRKENIQDSTIPLGAYQASPPIPDRPLETLGSRVLLICHRRLNRLTVTRLLEAILASPHVRALHPGLDESIVQTPPELPWHSASIAFRRRHESFATDQLLAELANTFTVAVPLCGACFLFWKRFRARLRDNRDLSMDRLVQRLAEIEFKALDLSKSRIGEIEPVEALLGDLTKIKAHGLSILSESSNDFEHRAIMGNFLAQVADARAFLNQLRLIAIRSEDIRRVPPAPAEIATESSIGRGQKSASESGDDTTHGR